MSHALSDTSRQPLPKFDNNTAKSVSVQLVDGELRLQDEAAKRSTKMFVRLAVHQGLIRY